MRHRLDRRALRDIGPSNGPEIAGVLGRYCNAHVIIQGGRIAARQSASAAKAAQRLAAR